eukprot:s2531_g7.t1
MISANKGAPVGKRMKPAPAKPVMPKAVDLDPSKLVLLDGTFRCHGKVVPQIAPRQLGPLASGVALMSAEEAEPYLRSGKPVSSEPLAICVFRSAGVDCGTELPHKDITIPCKCLLNQEPLLVEVTLVQLGVGHVEKFVANTAIALGHLVTVLPSLKRCHNTGCQCDCWHNPDSRQWLQEGFKPVTAEKSDIFSVCIRVPLCLIDGLLQCSGVSGVYTEPRTPDGKTVLDSYVVVWTPKLTSREIVHVKQTNPAIIGLARLGERKGVRVHSSQAQSMHELLRPETTFLPSGPRCQFVAGPFPWGSDRAAICKAMRQVGWQVKALQPQQPVPGRGTMWILQSVDDPPESVINMSHGEVLVSKHKAQEPQKAMPVMPVASANTLSLCGSAKSDSDPWSVHDPWKHYDKRVAFTPANEGMNQMEQRIESAVLAKLQNGMPMDQEDDRIAALEGQVQALTSKHQSLEVKFGEFSTHHNQQMSSMQVQLEQQSQNLHGHLQSHSQSVQAMFEQQMSQIRNLLAKRPREDNME